jgi:ribosomal protein S18 acetylase RimI-like enzyme
MSGPVRVRRAVENDLLALTRLDLSYPANRVLALERSGEGPEHTFSLRWRHRDATGDQVYAKPTVDWLRAAQARADLFLVAEADGEMAGYLMTVVPAWTDAAEITDLAVHRPLRRRGAGRALVDAALEFARSRGLRALWVEPRADNAEAIDFYTALDFRIAGFNDRMYSNRDDEAGRVTLFMYRDLT